MYNQYLTGRILICAGSRTFVTSVKTSKHARNAASLYVASSGSSLPEPDPVLGPGPEKQHIIASLNSIIRQVPKVEAEHEVSD